MLGNWESDVSMFIQTLIADDRGQDLIEYALLAGFVSLVVVAAVTNLGTTTNGIYSNIDTQVALIPGP